jgi:putative spermidine/putrescine transport system ATP-binding protein
LQTGLSDSAMFFENAGSRESSVDSRRDNKVMSDKVVLEGLTKRFGRVIAAEDIHLNVKKSELISLLGPSGCGKTTTLRMIAGFIMPDEGRVLIEGQDVTYSTPDKRDTAMVFQSYALFPHMTVFDNVAFGLRMRRVSKSDIVERVKKALALVRLESVSERYPSQLSGGQRQRVALSRALVVNPSVLLLDEPLSNLDAKLRQEMQVELRQLQRELNLTSIYVTHDQEEAFSLSDRIVVLNEGRIQQIGTPKEVFECPNSHFVADFVGVRNFMDGTFESDTFTSRSGLKVHCKGTNAGAGKLGLRPSKIVIDPPDDVRYINQFHGTVEFLKYAGNTTEVLARLRHGDRIVIEVSAGWLSDRSVQVGDDIALGWRREDTLAFPE